MNRTYRLVFNHALGLWQVASELVRSPRGQDVGGEGVVSAALRPLGFALWVCLGWVGLAAAPALAQQAQGRVQHEQPRPGHGSLPRVRHHEAWRVEVPRHQARHEDARGRIISDPNAPGQYRPVVLEGGNGVSLVHITTPSAAGVSRNLYSQFDVNREGVILNNSRTGAGTELGGWVHGNPWLATGTARIILNEVNSSNPSLLRGYVEVGGDRAQVVIANPSGIDCDGCGFINAGQLTLTTGLPVIESGTLQGYRVSGGTIVVGGAGLDATRVDYTDLISRSVQVNAGVWANHLQVIAGANAVDAAGGGVETIAAEGSGPTPRFAIDVGALGGMYAGKITLLGTEHGVGVRNAGNLGAQVGDLVVTVDGRLENTGALQSRQADTRIDADHGLANAGLIGAARELRVATAADLNNSGGTLNARRIEAEAQSLRNDGGAIEQTGAQVLLLEAGTLSNRAGGRIGIASAPATGTPGGDTPPDGGDSPGVPGDGGGDGVVDGGEGSGGLPPPGATLADGVLRIAAALDNDGGRINAGGGVDLEVTRGVDNSDGHLGLRALTLTEGGLGNAGGELVVSGDARLQVGHIDNDGGRLEVAGALQVGATDLSNRAGTLAHGGSAAAAIHVTGTFDNSGGTLASNATALSIDGGVLVNEDGRIEHAGTQGLELRAAELAGRGGEIVTAGAATVQVGTADHREALLAASRMELDARDFDNRGGTVAATVGDLNIRAATFGNAGGSLSHGGDGTVTIDVHAFDGAGGSIASNGALHLGGDVVDLAGGTTAAWRITIEAGELTTAGGSLVASGDEALALQLDRMLDNRGGTIAGNGALDLSAGALYNRDGVIQAAGAAATAVQVAGSFDNTRGTLAAVGDIALSAAELVNAAGTVQAVEGAGLQVTVDGLLDNSADGLIAAQGELEVAADVLGNSAGRIEHAGEGSLAIHARAIEGTGGTIIGDGSLELGGDVVDLADGTTVARRITIEAGDLTTAGGSLVASGDEALALQVDRTLDNRDGTIAGNGALDLSAGTLHNRDGVIQAAGTAATTFSVAGSFDNTGGTLAAAGDITLTAAELGNAGGLVQAVGGAALQVTVDGLLDNSAAGLIAAEGELEVTADVLDNSAGRIEHAGEGSLAIHARELNGSGGSIIGNGSLHLAGDAINVADGLTSAQRITVESGDLTTAGGSLVASGEEALALQVGRTLDNSGGTIAGNGALDLAAGVLYNRDGVIQAAGAGATTLWVDGTFDNAGGILAAAGDIALSAAELVNAGGLVQAVDGAGLQVTVDGLLDNSAAGLIAAEGELGVAADVLDNSAGRIEHSGEGMLAIDARVIDSAGGTIAGNGSLRLAGDAINVAGGLTSAQRITVEAGDLTTAGGSLVASGEDALSLQVGRTLDNSGGTIAGNGALDLSAGALHNRDGVIQAAGTAATAVQVAGSFDNTRGTLAAAGDIALSTAELVNAAGTIQAVEGAALQVAVDGLLDNSAAGLVAAEGELEIAADVIDNTAGRIEHAGDGTLAIGARVIEGAGGAILGNGSLELGGDVVDLADGTTAARRITIEAGDLITAGGSLVASGDEALTLQVGRTLDNRGGTIAGNGALDLSAGALHNRDGVIQAAGAAATTVQVAGTFDNTRGTLAAAGETAVHAGELINASGLVQVAGDAELSITSDGRLVNDAGMIAGNGDITLQAQRLDNQQGMVQAWNTLAATITGLLDNSRGAMIAGGDLLLQADTLRNRDTGGTADHTGLFGTNLVLDATSVDNRQGSIVAAEALAVTAASVDNAGGSIHGADAVEITADHLDNAGGSLVQSGTGGSLEVRVSGLLDNTAGGLVGAEGAAGLAVGTLDNSGGTVFAREGLRIASTAGVVNREGGLLQTAGSLDLQAQGALDNSGGEIDAAGGASVGAARIDNARGRLLAGSADDESAALSLDAAGTLDNRGGTIGSRGSDLDLAATQVDNSGGGVLTAGRDLSLDTGGVDNAGGTVYATRHLRYENAAATLENRGGRFGAGDTAWLDLARVTNGDDGRIQADTLWLAAPSVDNAGGDISANVLHAQFDVLDGAGRIYGAQWLNLHFSGDFTYLQDQQLESDGALGLHVAGTFTNLGTLQSASELAITAVDVTNAGTLNASNADGTGLNRIVASGHIDNRDGGRIEGDSVELEAGDVTNTGDIVGDTVTVFANTLTNGRDLGQALAERDYGEGFIGAAQHLELRVAGRLSNLDGELFSGGDMVVAGHGPDGSTGLVENISGRIQAEGDLSIIADAIVNERRVLRTEHRAYIGQEQLDDPDAGVTSEDTVPHHLQDTYCPDGFRSYCMYFYGWTEHESRVLEGTRVLEASAAGQILSGGDMLLTGSLDNVYSAIAAGGSLTIAGRTSGDSDDPGDWSGVVNNVALSGYKMIEQTSTAHIFYQTCPVDMTCDIEPREIDVTFDIQTRHKAYVLAEGSATISAGQGVTIVGGDVNNTVVQAGDGLAGMGPGAVAGPGSTALVAASDVKATAVEAVDAAQGRTVAGNGPVERRVGEQVVDGPGLDAAQADTVGTGNAPDAVQGASATGPVGFDGPAPQLVGTPEAPLPGLVPPDNGMFDLHADPDAPFMVTTAPRFAPDDATGSDYLLGQLGLGDDLHKRLGDAYYEQRLVLDQLLRLTGRRTLDGSDGLAQYRTLMDNAARTAAALGLELGAPLTASQITALNQDIVWLVEQVIDGQAVLVPVVYLSQASAERLRGEGALVAGTDVAVQSSGTVRNDGIFSAGQGLWLAADTLINEGTLRGDALLAVATAGDTVNRGQLVGGTVVVDAGRDFVQTASGSLEATGSAVVGAGRDLRLEATRIAAGEHLVLGAGRDLAVDASRVTAGGDLAVAAGRDLSVTARTVEVTGRHGNTVSTRKLLQAGTLQAGGDMTLAAGRDMSLEAARVQAGDSLALTAGRDLELGTVTTTDTSLTEVHGRRSRLRQFTSDETVHGTSLEAGGDIAIAAGRDATLTAAEVISEEGGVVIGAGRDVVLDAVQKTSTYERETHRSSGGFFSSSRSSTQENVRTVESVGTVLDGQTVAITADRNLMIHAGRINAEEDITLVSGGHTILSAGRDGRFESRTSSRAGSKFGMTSSRNEVDSSQLEVTAAPTVLRSGGAITSIAGGNLLLHAPMLDAEQVSLHAGLIDPDGQLTFEGVKESTETSHTEQGRGVLMQRASGEGGTEETLLQARIHGELNLSAGGGIIAQLPEGELRQQLDQLAQQPGQVWLAELEQLPDVQWQQVGLAFDQWDYSESGLTTAAAVVVAVVVAIVTQGAGAGWLDAMGFAGTATTTSAAGATVTTATTSGAMANAAVTTLATQASISLINNGGDISQTLDDLGSSASVRSVLAGMLTAGVTQSFGADYGIGRTLAETAAGCASGEITGSGCEDAASQAALMSSLAWMSHAMRQHQIESSERFTGICDSSGECLTNTSGPSAGVDGDGIKIGGGRINLRHVCEAAPVLCTENGVYTGKVVSKYIDPSDATHIILPPGEVLRDGVTPLSVDNLANALPKSPLGGLQGWLGQLNLGFSSDYAPGSFSDTLVESFAGSHDWLNASHYYDNFGNNVSKSGLWGSGVWNVLNIGFAAPFGISTLCTQMPGLCSSIQDVVDRGNQFNSGESEAKDEHKEQAGRGGP